MTRNPQTDREILNLVFEDARGEMWDLADYWLRQAQTVRAERDRLRAALHECRNYHAFCLERAPAMAPCWKAEHQEQIDTIEEAIGEKD